MHLLVKDTAFDSKNTREYDLSIRISADGFSFCIYHPLTKTFVCCKHVDFSVKDTKYYRNQAIALCEPYLAYEYRRTLVVFADEKSTLIPEGVFQPANYLNILHFNYPETKHSGYELFINNLTVFSITNIFAVYTEQITFWKEVFPSAEFIHMHTPLIDALLKESKKEDIQLVWLYIQPTSIFLSYADKGKLIFSNTFPIQSATDIVYACGNVFEQFGLSQHHTKLILTGNYTSKSEIYSLLHTHFAMLDEYALASDIIIQSSCKSSDIQKLMDLLLVPLCV